LHIFSENRAVYEIMLENVVGPNMPQVTICWSTETVRFAKARIRAHVHDIYYLLLLRALLPYNNAEGNHCCISVATLNIRVLLTTAYTPTTKKRGSYCCVSMAATVTRTRHSVTLYVNSLVFIFNFRQYCIALHIDMLLFPALCTI
jgi:hypothetical protein